MLLTDSISKRWMNWIAQSCLHASGNPCPHFLYHKFAYTFAYNALRSSLEASKENPSAKKVHFAAMEAVSKSLQRFDQIRVRP